MFRQPLQPLQALHEAFPLSQVPQQLPANSAGRKLHRNIAFRWAQRGVRGIRLQTIELPGIGKCTTVAWLQEFIDGINARPSLEAGPRRDRRRRSPQRRSLPTAAVLSRHGLTAADDGEPMGGPA